jgi:hypothetical protein
MTSQNLSHAVLLLFTLTPGRGSTDDPVTRAAPASSCQSPLSPSATGGLEGRDDDYPGNRADAHVGAIATDLQVDKSHQWHDCVQRTA